MWYIYVNTEQAIAKEIRRPSRVACFRVTGQGGGGDQLIRNSLLCGILFTSAKR